MSLTAPLQTEHYTFRFHRGASERVPMAFDSVVNGSATPIDLTDKNLEISFIAKDAVEPFMILNTDGTGSILIDGVSTPTTDSYIAILASLIGGGGGGFGGGGATPPGGDPVLVDPSADEPEWDFEVFVSALDTPNFPLGQGKWCLMLIDGSDREVLWNDFINVKELYG